MSSAQIWLDASISSGLALLGGVAKGAYMVVNGESFSAKWFVAHCFLSSFAGFMWGLLSSGSVREATQYGIAALVGYAAAQVLEVAEDVAKNRVKKEIEK